jgi:hypothetical protein
MGSLRAQRKEVHEKRSSRFVDNKGFMSRRLMSSNDLL